MEEIMDLSKEYQTRRPVGSLTKGQVKYLDSLFQELGLRDAHHKSILGGVAVVVHHFKGRRNLATRWYRPNQIPLTHPQHNSVESVTGKAVEQEIIDKKGVDWLIDLNSQSQKTARYLNYKHILEHLMGQRDNYL